MAWNAQKIIIIERKNDHTASAGSSISCSSEASSSAAGSCDSITGSPVYPWMASRTPLAFCCMSSQSTF